MTAQIKTTIGEVHVLLEKAVDYYRLKMTHGCKLGKKVSTGFFASERLQYPMDKGDYWPLMMQTHPWKEIAGFYNAALTFPPDREMWISVELAGKLGIGARGFNQ